jgi:hypothetical protein
MSIRGRHASASRQAPLLAARLPRRGALLGEPRTRQLVGKLWEMRFRCGCQRERVWYWIGPVRRIIMLAVFTEIRMRETAGVRRADAVRARCHDDSRTADEEG